MRISVVEALIFDLDDTLYPERSFVESGFRAVASHIADIHGGDSNQLFQAMLATLETQGRYEAFPMLQKLFPDTPLPLSELIGVYRGHNPRICMFAGYLELLQKLALHYKLGIITDGLPEVQARKIDALGLQSVMDQIIYTWEYGPEKEKPHPFSFSLMLQSLQTNGGSAIYIGDNPVKDCKGAHGAGMLFAQVSGSFPAGDPSAVPDLETPDFVIGSLLQLPNILNQMS
jgi:putative hydrolase of the HAD superfamily